MNIFKKSDSQPKGTCFLDVSAEEASNLLMTQGKDGSFIIRPSESDAGNQSLTVRHKDSVVHIKIQNAGEVYDLYGGEQFATLMELIDFYKTGEKLRLQNGDFICFTQPLNSDATRFRCERWFHGNISSSEAEGRLKKAAEHSFLVRECQSHQGDFVLCVRMGDSNVTHIIIKKQNTKYDIGDGALFNDLSKLIDNYRKNQITAMHNGKELKFTLQKAVNLGKIKASDISSRAGELAKRFPGQDKDRDGFWEEFEQITHEESASEIYTKPRVAGKQEQNIKKNRFKNILPYDETRVILKDKDESDYINANYIDVSRMDIKGHQRKYIATQGCLKNTAGDFWRMVWQEKSSIIVMTTCTVEMGKNKCYQYWPEEQGTSMTVELTNGSFMIEHVSEQLSNNFYVRVLHVTRESIKQKDKKQTVENLGTRTVYHFHYPEWPDKRAPKDSHTVTILQFIAAVNDKQKELNDTSPLIVHCSAGIGRTGTYILIDIFCNLIQQKGLDHPIDIPSTLFKLRQMRSGLVQTDAQYAFVYTAIREFVNHLMDKKSPPVQVQQPVLKPDESIYENAEKSPDQRSPTTGRPPVGQKPKLDPAAVYANCGGGTVRN